MVLRCHHGSRPGTTQEQRSSGISMKEIVEIYRLWVEGNEDSFGGISCSVIEWLGSRLSWIRLKLLLGLGLEFVHPDEQSVMLPSLRSMEGKSREKRHVRGAGFAFRYPGDIGVLTSFLCQSKKEGTENREMKERHFLLSFNRISTCSEILLTEIDN